MQPFGVRVTIREGDELLLGVCPKSPIAGKLAGYERSDRSFRHLPSRRLSLDTPHGFGVVLHWQ